MITRPEAEQNLNHLNSALIDDGNQQGTVNNNTMQQTAPGPNLAPGWGQNINLTEFNPNYLFFLGGFVEGEGSNSVSISVSKTFKYGINIQPIFNVSQHENGLKLLESFKTYFGVGSVVQKSGAPHVWVYTVKGYKHIIKHVMPFLETYVQPYSCKKQEYQLFKQLVLMSEAGAQKNKETLIEMVKIAYTLIGKGKGRKRTLSEVLEIINDKEAYLKKNDNSNLETEI